MKRASKMCLILPEPRSKRKASAPGSHWRPIMGKIGPMPGGCLRRGFAPTTSSALRLGALESCERGRTVSPVPHAHGTSDGGRQCPAACFFGARVVTPLWAGLGRSVRTYDGPRPLRRTGGTAPAPGFGSPHRSLACVHVQRAPPAARIGTAQACVSSRRRARLIERTQRPVLFIRRTARVEMDRSSAAAPSHRAFM